MKAVRIIALKHDRKRLLEHLQDSALIHVKHSDDVQDGFARADTSAQLKQFEKNADLTEKALKILGNVAPEKKGLLDGFKGRREIDADEIGDIAQQAAKIIGICGKICRIDEQITDNIAEQARIRTLTAQLEVWKKLDIPLNTGDTNSMAVFIGTLPKQYDEQLLAETLAEKCPELVFELEVVYSSSNVTSIVVFTPKKQKEQAELTLRSIGFSRPLNPTSKIPLDKAKRLAKKSNDLRDKNDDLREQIANYADYRDAIRDTQDYFEMRAEKYRVISELDQTEHVFVLNGYIPEQDCGKLEEICQKVPSAIIEFEEAGDDAPVKLKNNKFAEPAQSIVTMYASPSKEDIDPTPVLAFFFYWFFGMMFSDAGYGLLLVIGTAIGLKILKPDKSMRNNLKLFQYCGISTVIWGLVFGSFFGDAPAVFWNTFTGSNVTMKQLMPWMLDTQKDALFIMIMSIAFGLVHVLVGMGCKFYVCFRQKKYAEAFFDTGLWMLLLTGLAVLAAGMAFGQILTYIGAGIAIACVVGLILTQGRSKKGIFGKLIGGVASLYDITSYVSDLLSYSRLMALGLTTGVMAQVFNMLSTLFGTSVFGIICMAVVFIVGHAVTIGLNVLGSYVHTMRLQYVEMFSKFYEGGGKPFEPFSAKTKNFKIKNTDE